MRRLGLPLLVALALAVPASPSEIYRWTDEQGRTHFTQDLSQVPRAHRAKARTAARDGAGRGVLVRTQRASPPAGLAPSTTRAARPGKVTRIKVQRAGTSMRVIALLNHRVRAPFVVDTGASDVSIPRWVADELGLVIDERTRRQVYQTANGHIEEPIITLDSVDLGGAVAENVAASVSSSMPIGLLGLSFFNRFRYQVDPQQGVITLEPNGLEANGWLRGGRSESEWRMQFRQLRGRRAQVEARIARLPPAHGRLLDQLDDELVRLDEQMRELEIEADRAQVPYPWRE